MIDDAPYIRQTAHDTHTHTLDLVWLFIFLQQSKHFYGRQARYFKPDRYNRLTSMVRLVICLTTNTTIIWIIYEYNRQTWIKTDKGRYDRFTLQ
jgi:hypothetical protein